MKFFLKKPDIRQYSHSRSFGTTTTYPLGGLKRVPLAVYDQEATEFCTGFSMAGAMSFKMGFPVSPEVLVAAEGEVNGQPILDGATMDDAPEALQAYGLIAQKDSPYSLQVDGPVKVSAWSNYPASVISTALKYVQGSYYTAHDGPLDAFGNIMSAIYKAHLDGEEIAVQCGTTWYAEFNGAAENKLVMPMPVIPVSDHAWVIFDGDGKDTAYALLSSGKDFGNNGVLEFPREVINFLFQNPNATTRVMRDKNLSDGAYSAQVLQFILNAAHQVISLYQQLLA